ncbi:MAG: tRNA lysidine(34) synthetase TilS [Gammaproteobacteria bacterium GWE2_37_16]|nr:MAG: tRNA lysidine(34) synthetase TilS [Gammaproteobacteria bacterium GWE2_37_16]
MKPSQSDPYIPAFLNSLILSLCSGADKKVFLAYSGGLDSKVLLHALVILKIKNPELQISAIHINHGLSPNADQWAKNCLGTCRKFGIDLIIKKISVKTALQKGHSLEAVARDLRYAAFTEILNSGDLLLTAHHSDDQAETLLLQLFRGAGPKGLSAMPEKMPLGKGFLLRPLLPFSRHELEEYAHKNHLEWHEDESNADINFDRNYIRHTIMPLIKKRWGGILGPLCRVAEHCAEASELLNDLANQDYLNLQGTKPHTLSVKKLLSLSVARQSNVLRYWLHLLQLPTPSCVKLQNILHDVLLSRSDAMPLVTWREIEVRRYGDDIYTMSPLQKLPGNLIIPWEDLEKPLVLPYKLGTLDYKNIADKAGLPLPPKDKITIRFRQGGERIKLPNRQGTHSLKKLFQEWRVPPWQRNLIPLVYCDEKLIWVCILNENRFPGLAQIDSSSLDFPLGGNESSLRSVLDIHDSNERESQQRGKNFRNEKFSMAQPVRRMIGRSRS